MTGIRFRIVENGKPTREGLPMGGVIELVFPNGKPNPFRPFGEQYVLDHYNKLKKENPNAEIVVVVENIMQEFFTPLTKLNKGDIGVMLSKLDERVKKGL